MSEHSPMDPFDTRLTALARSYTEPAVRLIDPLATARAAKASTTRGSVIGRLLPTGLDRGVAWLLLIAALVVLAALAVAVGSRPSVLVRAPDGPGRIVFVRDGDLFVAADDGSGQTLIASGDADDVKFGYLTAAWSPDMRHIAAVRDVGGAFLTPGVDLLTADGALVRTVTLGAGCGPSVSWSPDSSKVAIAPCPADVPRDAIETSIESEARLVIAGLDASADREVALPPELTSVASARREVWIRPDLWAQWSPDGRFIDLWAIAAGRSEWYLVAADGSGTRRIEELTDSLGGHVFSLDWSRDGRRLAISGDWVGCVDEPCLGIVDAQGGPVTSTVGHPSAGDPNMHGKLIWPEFSPDGERVAVLGLLVDFSSEPPVAETYTLYNYHLATARLSELTSGKRTMILGAMGAAQNTGTETGELVFGGSVAWTPDGRRLLYLVREVGDSAVWTIRSIDATGGSQSSVLVQGVQSFDIGPSN